jgi:hypothetical protein
VTVAKRRVVVLGIAAVAVAAAAGGVTAWRLGLTGGDDGSSGSGGSSSVAAATGVYGADTAVDSLPPDPVHVATDKPRPTPEKDAPRTVVVVYSGWDDASSAIEVDGYVAEVVEAGGTCTLTLTRGGASAQVSAPAEPDASTTSCGALRVPADQLSAGTWKAVLAYESATSSGTADAVEVTVP